MAETAKAIAAKIYNLRSSQKILNAVEKEETARLRSIAKKIDGVCEFESVSSRETDWKAVAESLFLQYNVDEAKAKSLTDANTKEISYEALVFEKGHSEFYSTITKQYEEIFYECLIGLGPLDIGECDGEQLPNQYLASVKQNGCALRAVPEKFKTPEICFAAVKQDGEALQFVPEKLKTAEMCLEAVKEEGWSYEFVPEEFKTEELRMVANRQVGEKNIYPEFGKFVSAVKKFATKTWELYNLLMSIETNSHNDEAKETIKDLSSDESKKILELDTMLSNLAKVANERLNDLKTEIHQNAGKAWLPNNNGVRRDISTLKHSIGMARNSIEGIREKEKNIGYEVVVAKEPGQYEDILSAVYEFAILIKNYIADPSYAAIKLEYDALHCELYVSFRGREQK